MHVMGMYLLSCDITYYATVCYVSQTLQNWLYNSFGQKMMTNKNNSSGSLYSKNEIDATFLQKPAIRLQWTV